MPTSPSCFIYQCMSQIIIEGTWKEQGGTVIGTYSNSIPFLKVFKVFLNMGSHQIFLQHT